MANLNCVHLIGRLGRDPECRTFANGGKVANFSICVNNRKKNQQTGQWEDDPVWLYCSAFNQGDNGKTADLVEKYLKKGQQVFVEGRLVEEKWTDKEGQERKQIKIRVQNVQFLEPRPPDQANGQAAPQQRRQAAQVSPVADDYRPPVGDDESLPF